MGCKQNDFISFVAATFRHHFRPEHNCVFILTVFTTITLIMDQLSPKMYKSPAGSQRLQKKGIEPPNSLNTSKMC